MTFPGRGGPGDRARRTGGRDGERRTWHRRGPGAGRRPGARAGAARPPRPDRRRGGRQPQPVGRERRAAGHRRGVRLLADDAQPHRRGVLARPRGVGALVRRAGRPLRPQADDRARDGAFDPGFASRRVRALGRGALRRARRGRVVRRDGLSDDPRADHGALVGRGPDEGDRALVGARRRDRRARPARVGRAARALRLGLRLPRDAAARGPRPPAGDLAGPGARERVDRAGGQHRRPPLGVPGRRARDRDQLSPGARREDARAVAAGGRDRHGRALLRAPAPGRESRSTTSESLPARRSGSRAWPESSSSAH